MRDEADLRQRLRSIDGRSYKAYEQIEGEYRFNRFLLTIDHAQGDPFASPSMLRVRVPRQSAEFPPELFSSRARRIALEDFITRAFASAIRRLVKGHRGTGHSGLIAVDVGGQEILERTSCVVTDQHVEVRFALGLPAYGRSCQAAEATPMFFQEIPALVDSALYHSALNARELESHVEASEDQEAMRDQLQGLGLVAFVGDGSILPRASGISDHPLTGPNVVAFTSPSELRVELRAPNRGQVSGMGIPRGVTLIVGGGYHGKSTLLAALSRGVYNQIPGDGRELVVTRGDAVKIRAEDGRSVEKVDISPFITNLPFQKDTSAFGTENASGSTSQAANIIEALEYGSSLLLIDEDTSATNFMIRDGRMQRLVPKEGEPITPFIDQVRNLDRQYDVSTVVVVGGSGDYFDVADHVIRMKDYWPSVVTAEARRIASEMPTRRETEAPREFGQIVPRAILPESLDPHRRGRTKVSARGLHAILFGYHTIDLQYLEQLVDQSQTRAIADIMLYGLQRGYFAANVPLSSSLQRIYEDISTSGLDILSAHPGQHPGDYALPRLQETAQAINRLREIEVRQLRGR